MKTYLFEIPGVPFAKQRARTLKSGRSYTPTETVQYENLVKTCFTQKYPCESPTEEFITVDILAVYPVPTSWSKKDKIKADQNRIFPKKHDWDNIGKIVCDALNGVVWKDDKQIMEGQVCKRFGDRPRVVVLITIYDEAYMNTDPMELIDADEKEWYMNRWQA